MGPLADARLVCVSDHAETAYSGMLSGVLAGQYEPQDMRIDLVRLVAAARGELVLDSIASVDLDDQKLIFEHRPPLHFDVLSLGFGSAVSEPDHDDTFVPIKPMQDFIARLDERLRTIDGSTVRMAIVGAGAGGLEIALCLPRHVDRPLELTLIDAHDATGGLSPGAARRVHQLLAWRGVRIVTQARVIQARGGEVLTQDGRRFDVDIAIGATGASPQPVTSKLGLPLAPDGFLRIDDRLRVPVGPAVFAVGDCASHPGWPKAGVYAVRQGPVLWNNIGHALAGETLARYRPQRDYLKLVNTGDGKALLDSRGLAVHASWCWRLKDDIDGRFVDRYKELAPMAMRAEPAAPLACGGCGSKLPERVLSRVLKRLRVPDHPDVVLGLGEADDAAIVRTRGSTVVTTDFFRPPVADPWIAGRLAAQNALSDAHAMGAFPRTAVAMVVLPPGPEHAQEEHLQALLAGGVREIEAAGATLVGGHTVQGLNTMVGFTVLADPAEHTPFVRGGLRPGQDLFLTKPLGTGILLAAHMLALCEAAWYEELVSSMLTSNAPAAHALAAHGVTGVTDVTGFGLAGHLAAMLEASGVVATIQIDTVPALSGAVSLGSRGVQSTLAPPNRAGVPIRWSPSSKRHPKAALLFDPQTCGGLLLGVPASHGEELRQELATAGVIAIRIGSVTGQRTAASHMPLLRVQ